MRATWLVPLLLVACSNGGGSARPTPAPVVTAPPTTAPATTTPPAPTPPSPSPTVWPPAGYRIETAREFVTFRTPTGNIACGIGTEAASCEIREHTWRLPPKDPDCEYDWVPGAAISVGNGFELGLCQSDTVFGAERVLAYGTGIRYGDLTCVSEQAGVTCAFEDGQGFFLSRNAAREL